VALAKPYERLRMAKLIIKAVIDELSPQDTSKRCESCNLVEWHDFKLHNELIALEGMTQKLDNLLQRRAQDAGRDSEVSGRRP